MTEYPLIKEKKFTYLELGDLSQKPIILLHGLFGTASNFDQTIKYLSKKRHVVLPILPIFEMPLIKLSLDGLVDYLQKFIRHKGYENFYLLGNSLGGHLALLLALKLKKKVSALILTASSGLYESAFGTTFPRREDYYYIRKKMELTFYDPNHVTEEMVEEVYGIVSNRASALRIVKTAKSAIRNNVGDRLHDLKIPTLLVWGKQDTITPPFVAEKFDSMLPNSELHILDKCGHAPMLERPKIFNKILETFLDKVDADDIEE